MGMTHATNSLNRRMGQPDRYLFVCFSPRAIEKLGFVHAARGEANYTAAPSSVIVASETGNCYRWMHFHKRRTFADAYDKSRIYLLPPELSHCGMGDAPVTWDNASSSLCRGLREGRETVARRGESSKQTYNSGGNPMKTLQRYAQLVIAILVLAGCAATPTQESTGEYLDDTTITTKVKTALLNDPQVSGLAINVETFKGTVQLSGFANSEDESQRAAELARSVDGVQSVRNDIRLK